MDIMSRMGISVGQMKGEVGGIHSLRGCLSVWTSGQMRAGRINQVEAV